jgi:hypothetical protein
MLHNFPMVNNVPTKSEVLLVGYTLAKLHNIFLKEQCSKA